MVDSSTLVRNTLCDIVSELKGLSQLVEKGANIPLRRAMHIFYQFRHRFFFKNFHFLPMLVLMLTPSSVQNFLLKN